MTVGELRKQLMPFADEAKIMMATGDTIVDIDRVKYVFFPEMPEAVLWLERRK
ncbi:MAG TPA: hypothetical protein VM656_03515 [Pyrinomonadaceae bacterium]|nr:hypothetical protein [Pyrinomonadaceae bacterium]